jgi:hypothetical protein
MTKSGVSCSSRQEERRVLQLAPGNGACLAGQDMIGAADHPETVSRQRGELQVRVRAPRAADTEIDLVVPDPPMHAPGVVVVQHQANACIAGAKAIEDVRHQADGHRGDDRDVDLPAASRGLHLDAGDRLVEVLEKTFGHREKILAVDGQAHLPCGPFEQHDADAVFQLLDGQGQRRLRQQETLRRAGEIALARDRDEGTQMPEIDRRFQGPMAPVYL